MGRHGFLGDEFIPASQLSDMRRRLADALTATLAARRPILKPAAVAPKSLPPEGARLTHRSNVANRLADKFYRECGVESIEPAIELKKRPGALRWCLWKPATACAANSWHASKRTATPDSPNR